MLKKKGSKQKEEDWDRSAYKMVSYLRAITVTNSNMTVTFNYIKSL